MVERRFPVPGGSASPDVRGREVCGNAGMLMSRIDWGTNEVVCTNDPVDIFIDNPQADELPWESSTGLGGEQMAQIMGVFMGAPTMQNIALSGGGGCQSPIMSDSGQIVGCLDAGGESMAQNVGLLEGAAGGVLQELLFDVPYLDIQPQDIFPGGQPFIFRDLPNEHNGSRKIKQWNTGTASFARYADGYQAVKKADGTIKFYKPRPPIVIGKACTARNRGRIRRALKRFNGSAKAILTSKTGKVRK